MAVEAPNLLEAWHSTSVRLQQPPKGWIYTFGYGSNLCLGRLRCRVPSACAEVAAVLHEHKFLFHKVSQDGSGKGDAYCTHNAHDRVLGVVFRIRQNHVAYLDHAEGKGNGYRVRWLSVAEMNGPRTFRARTYVATRSHIDPKQQPYSWYKAHVIKGGQHFGLDADYLRVIAGIPAKEDPIVDRMEREAEFPCDQDVSAAKWAHLDCNERAPEPCE